MNTSRDELLGLLRSLGVELPRKTKLPDTELEKRLSKALDCCQYFNRVAPSPPLDPTCYTTWNMKNKALEAVRRHNFGEATFIHESKMRGVEQPFPLYENAFMDLRQSLMTIGHNWDSGNDLLVFQDKTELSGIVMRVLEVREFDTRTPIFVVIFAHDTRAAPNPKTIDWISSYVGKPGEKPPIANVTATPQEQQLLLRLLKQNSKRLSVSYKPKRAKTEGSFTLSFLLPVGPLGPKEMGTFNRNDGCSVCGVPAKSKCSRCGAIRYCGAVCQKEDWKLHRPTCTSLMGGTWQRLTFTIMNPSRGLVINRFTNVFDNDLKAQISNNSDDSTLQSPPNTHGCMPFIVKAQLNTDMEIGPLWPIRKTGQFAGQGPDMNGIEMLIYDRQRTFEVHVIKNLCGSNADFEAVANVVKKGDRGLKAFLWAIRTGEWTIDLCLNQLPEWQKW